MNGDAATLLVNFCVCGPMIYLGLWMMMGPSKMVSVLNGLGAGVRRFRDDLQSSRWRDAFLDAGSLPDSTIVHIVVRLVGVSLAMAGFVRLAGFVD